MCLAGLFNQTVGEISDKYTVFITPAGWTFSIWSVIYIYLAAGVIYSILDNQNKMKFE